MTKRNVNVDFFRIIATIFVVVLHILGQGGILEKAVPGGTMYWTAWFFEICAYCAVDCFALITGFVMVNKTVKVKNMINLWFQVIFYSLTINTLFFVLVPESRTIKNMAIALFPILGKQWWYISAYFALCLFIPVLNEGIKNISQQTHKKLLFIILIVISCIGCIFPIDAFRLHDGSSAIWFMIVYLFGAYIKKYSLDKRITALKSILGYFAMILLTFTSKFVFRYLTNKFFGGVRGDNIFISYVSVTIILSSVFLFLFCLNIKINRFGAKLISFFAPVTLGVYLIHVQPLVFHMIMKDAFVSFIDKPIAVMTIFVFITALAIFVSCSMIELLRIQLFKLLRVGKLCELIDHRINYYYLKLFEK